MTHGMADPERPKIRQPRPLVPEDAASSAFKTSGHEVTPLRSFWPGRLIIGSDTTASGRRYVFEQAGAIVDVQIEDVPILLALQRGPTGCCGSSGEGERRYLAEV